MERDSRDKKGEITESILQTLYTIADSRQLTIAHNMTEMTDGSDYWDPELLSQSLLGIWFAAAHQPWMFLDFILLELSTRLDWQHALQKELDTLAPSSYHELEKLPLLDSFIKETIRLNPLDKCKC